MIPIVRYSYITFIFSAVTFVAAVVLLFVYGVRPGIDFTGGTLLEVHYTQGRPSIEDVQTMVTPLHFGTVSVQPAGEENHIIKTRFLSEDEHQLVLAALRKDEASARPESVTSSSVGDVTSTLGVVSTTLAQRTPTVLEERFETIGPSVSAQLRRRSVTALVVVSLMIILFIAFAFRKVARPVAAWKYGVAAVVAVVHDIVITLGIFAFLGATKGVEIDIPFIVALLTIFGYSVNDTIVVFDRIRENLHTHREAPFPDIVNMAVNQTMMRSINTSMITLLVLLALYFFGGSSIHYFSLALLIGIFFGTYSSIFLASPLLVSWYHWSARRASKNA